MQNPQQGLRLEISQAPEMETTMKQIPSLGLPEVQKGTRLYLAGWVRGNVQRALDARIQYKAGGSVVIPDDAFEGVSARISRAVFYKLLKDSDVLAQEDLPSAAKLERTIGDYADSEVKTWYEMQKSYALYDKWLPERDVPGVKKFKEEHQGDRKSAELLQSYFSAIDLGAHRGRWGDFDRVRSSCIVDIDASNIDEYLPKIEHAYRQDEFNLEAFVHQKQRGFIFPDFDEPLHGKPSIRQQMLENFTMERTANDPLYKGKGLLDRHGELIAWGTYWQTPVRPGKKYREMMENLLSKGLTGAPMHYLRPATEFPKFHKEIKYTLHLYTIQSLVKMGMSRLFPHILQDALILNKSLKTLVGYRQLDLETDPPIILRNSTTRIAPNKKSGDFFQTLGCLDYAIDENINAEPAVRMLDGKPVNVNPAWVHFYGDVIEMYLRAWQGWRTKQYGYGDITNDGYNRSILHADINIPKVTASTIESETQHTLER